MPSALTFAGGACLAFETTHFMEKSPPHTFAIALRVISICSVVSIFDRTRSFANPITKAPFLISSGLQEFSKAASDGLWGFTNALICFQAFAT